MPVKSKNPGLRAPKQSRLRKKQGIWVYNSGTKLTAETVNRVIREIREERDRRNLGMDTK
jgi:hypothetical protein